MQELRQPSGEPAFFNLCRAIDVIERRRLLQPDRWNLPGGRRRCSLTVEVARRSAGIEHRYTNRDRIVFRDGGIASSYCHQPRISRNAKPDWIQAAS